MLVLLVAAALAADPLPPAALPGTAPTAAAPVDTDAPDAGPGASAAEAPPLRDPLDVIDEAIAVRRAGDPDAARSLLVAVEPFVPAGRRSWWLYQRGICEEMARRPAEAEAFYRQVLAEDGAAALDARFRLALVLEDQGRDAEALEEALALAKRRGLDERDAVTVALQRGVAEVNVGRVARGVRRIQRALAEVEGGETHRYMRAKARYTLARALLAEADALELDGAERRVVRRLEARAERILAAEKQIVAIAALEEPEWILAGLVALGDSYAALADDLAAAPVPRRLDEDQAVYYRSEVQKRAEVARTKAFGAWDHGVALATRIGWESPRVDTLKARRATLESVR